MSTINMNYKLICLEKKAAKTLNSPPHNVVRSTTTDCISQVPPTAQSLRFRHKIVDHPNPRIELFSATTEDPKDCKLWLQNGTAE